MAVPLVVIVLASGERSRGFSKAPLFLLPVAGRPMIDYALMNAEALRPSKIYVVVGPPAPEMVAHLGKRAIPVLSKKFLRSGHAVQLVLPYLKAFKGDVLVLYADDCLTWTSSVLALRQFHLLQNSEATFLTARLKSPFRYGRVIRGPGGEVERIVGEDEATEEQKEITEVNAGVYCFKAPALAQALKNIQSASGNKPFYITQAVPPIRDRGGKVQALMAPGQTEVLGISRPEQVTWAHRILNLRRVKDHQAKGVIFLNAQTVDIESKVVIGRGTVIEGNVQLLGNTVVGTDCRIEAGTVIQSSRLGRGVAVKSSRIVDSRLGEGCDAGPFAHIRGGSVLEGAVHVGTNAELKDAKIASGSKIGHFSYVGDARLGRDVNVGAGCVFANYDGKTKHRTSVGDKVFLGSNSTLVAPLRIGARAVIGAGAVVTKDVQPGTTVVGVPAKPLKKRKF